jgi:hypothetical protein
MVSDGLITTDTCRSIRPPQRLLAQVAFGDFLPDTALSRRVEVRAAAGAAGGGCGPGPLEPGGLKRGTSAIQLADLTRPRASRSS